MQLESREGLINALMDAAELEHNLACLYLFAKFSLKKRSDELTAIPAADSFDVLSILQGWTNELRKIAQQEMGHLGTVCNILTLLGAEAHFDRPNFPPADGYYPPSTKFVLQRFGSVALQRFVEFERNANLPGVQAFGMAPRGVTYNHVGELYAAILAAFEEISAGGISIANDQLFQGYGKKEMDRNWLSSTVEVHEFGLGNAPPIPIDSLRGAVRAALVDVIEEGEGSQAPAGDSHYELFFKIAGDLKTLIAKYPGFDPARPVADNPMTQPHRGAGPGINLITSQPAKDIAELFNNFYGTMLLVLRQTFAFSEDLSDAAQRLQKMHRTSVLIMRGAVGSIGELLTDLPLSTGSVERAGAGFELYRPLYISDNPQIAWSLIVERLQLAIDECDRLLASGSLSTQATAALTAAKGAAGQAANNAKALI